MDQLQAFRETVALAEERGMPLLSGSDVGLEHIRKQLATVESENFTADKLGRWLGWAQGVVVAAKVATLDDMREINTRNQTEETGDVAYIVSTGSYSEYSIRRVFLNPELAAEHGRIINTVESTSSPWGTTIEEWPIGKPQMQSSEYPGLEGWRWTPLGEFEEEYFAYSYDIEDGTKAKVVKSSPEEVIVIGYSEDHVQKVIYDEVARVRAEAEGIA